MRVSTIEIVKKCTQCLNFYLESDGSKAKCLYNGEEIKYPDKIASHCPLPEAEVRDNGDVVVYGPNL